MQIVRDFTAYHQDEGGLEKRVTEPHQCLAVTTAVGSTVDAVRSNGKAGVVWHTQGSGKSMEMELYANRVMRHPPLLNPTIVVITDRGAGGPAVRDVPAQPGRARVRRRPPSAVGPDQHHRGVDEARRSHYDDLDGYARHLKDAPPNATLIAFTGTPISFEDRNTQEAFGDCIDVYDLTWAVNDGATAADEVAVGI